MTLQELIDTTDEGMNHFKVIGCNNILSPTIGYLKTNPENWLDILNKQVKEWYTCEIPPKSGRECINVYLKVN